VVLDFGFGFFFSQSKTLATLASIPAVATTVRK